MASQGTVSNDQDVRVRLLCGSVQQLRDIAAVDDHFGLRAELLLKLGDVLGGGPDEGSGSATETTT
jgi:hypothetical protein